ncbi:MAG: inositol-3-phosphate synthase, partial [Phycisphaerae bacterium]
MKEIRVAIVGVGNCTSSLVQGIHYYRESFNTGGAEAAVGLAHPTLGGFAPGDINIVAAFDVDARKVGKPLHEAIFAEPNNTQTFYNDFTCDDVIVQMGNVADGVADHMGEFAPERRFVVADQPGASRREV